MTATASPNRHPREEHIRRARAKKADLWAEWLLWQVAPFVTPTVPEVRKVITWVAGLSDQEWERLADRSRLLAPSPETVRVIIYRLGDLAMRKIHS